MKTQLDDFISEIDSSLTPHPHTLYKHPLFNVRTDLLPIEKRIILSYNRARLIFMAYGLTLSDILHNTSKYWAMQIDPIFPQDMTCFIILATHVTLTLGTLARYQEDMPSLQSLIRSLLHFEAVGVYLLTERGHGLDAFNIETTATKTDDGFILHTPREEASKFMPATTPIGIPKVALVVAKLIVDGIDQGSRTFIVPICDDREMCKGVSSIPLPFRSGAAPMDFSITRFNNVLLPPTALLGPMAKTALDPRKAWWKEVSKIPMGTLAITAPLISSLKQTAYIGGVYSFRRKIKGKEGTHLPIISFRTQQWAVLQAIAISMVLEAWYSTTVQSAQDDRLEFSLRHAIIVIFKTTVCRLFQLCNAQVMERCGAQGGFDYNFMSRIDADARGAIIAEGDVLALSIRLFVELLTGRYEIPLPDASVSLLAKHAVSVLEENKRLSATIREHRSDKFNNLMLPQAESTVTAMGHALAYTAALESGVSQPLLNIYECAIMRLDSAWYAEQGGVSRFSQRYRENEAISDALPFLQEYLKNLDVKNYVSVPILDDEKWLNWLKGLHVYTGNAPCQVTPHHARL